MQTPRPSCLHLQRDQQSRTRGTQGGIGLWKQAVSIVEKALRQAVPTIDKSVENEFSVLLNQIVDVTEDATAKLSVVLPSTIKHSYSPHCRWVAKMKVCKAGEWGIVQLQATSTR
jgi:hypothetical protein